MCFADENIRLPDFLAGMQQKISSGRIVTGLKNFFLLHPIKRFGIFFNLKKKSQLNTN